MGVHGLWRLIEPSGKPVPVESLENKILAVDVSIWLHQAIKGFQDAKGAPALNAHLLGIFHRVCKLLYFKIKPVFVFDGGVPVLKRETIAKRNKLKHKNISEADKIQKQLLDTLIKHSAVNKVLGEKAKTELASVSSSKQEDDLFKLPKPEVKSENNDDQDSSSDSEFGSPSKNWNLHNIDTTSEHFKSLPADVRHEILTELKETRKQSSWGRLHELPTQSDDFSGFQMKRLLKRQEVQVALEEAEKEMGGHSLSLVELEEILKDQGVITKNTIGNRIASDENTRYLYIKDVKQALERARREEEKKKLKSIKEEDPDKVTKEEAFESETNEGDLELEADIQRAISLSLQDQPSGSGQGGRKKLSDFSFLENFDDADFESDTEDEDITQTTKITKLTSAQNYMMEYSGLAPNEIAKIISNNEKNKTNKRKISTILEDEIYRTDTATIGKSDKKHNNDEIDKERTAEPKIKRMRSMEDNDPSEVLLESENSSDNFEEVVMNVQTETVKQKPDFSIIDGDNISENNSDSVKISNFEDTSKYNKKSSMEELITGSEESEMEFEEVEETLSEKEIRKDDKSDSVKISNFESGKTKKIEVTEDTSKYNKEKSSMEAELISGSEESEMEFEEVEEILPEEDITKDDIMEIKIETKEFNEEDDFFADIFNSKNEICESKKEEDSIDEKSQNKVKEKKEEKIIGVKEHTDKSELLVELMEKAEDLRNKERDEKSSEVVISKKADLKDKPKLTEKDLITLQDDLHKEEQELRNEQGLRERLGTNITDQMYQEAQDLLELFGLPYVVAPMEAEAQCAFLETASLTDGTITDDSDIWLFGGKTVYKNFFNQSKHVLEYRDEDIKHHFKLTREQMILLALLVGSDYTTGLQGVGPVTAMEILANFPPSSTSSFTLSHNQLLVGLNEFKSWFVGGKSIARGKNSLRNKMKNVTFTEGFPSMQVVQAYLNPTVDDSEEQFSWSKPDIVGLIDFGRSKFGWSKIKTEDILKPIIKRMKESKYQSTLLNYFKIKHNLNAEEAQKLMSERVRLAVNRIGKDPKDIEESDGSDCEESIKIKKKKSDKGDKMKTISVKKKAKNVEDMLSDEFIEIDQIEALLENVEKETKTGKSKERKKKKLPKSSKLSDDLLQTGVKECDENKEIEKTKEVISVEPSESIETKKEESISLLKNKEMNLLIQVLSNQEPSTSKNATKIAKVKKVAEKIEKLINPELEPTKKKDSFENSTEQEKLPKVESNVMKLKRIAKKLEGKSVELNTTKVTKRGRKSKPSTSKGIDNIDEELQLLEKTKAISEKRVEEIKMEAEKMVQQELNKKKLIERKLHRKEIIPQREREQKNLMRTRMKAIEVFRKSKIDPCAKKGGMHKTRQPKEDAELSESSSDSDL
ncbi:DNA excision repair protein ERCC-5 isoform X2 [Harmonia axyridis]|uniref:DNA excision repair protein ERCC-5 isoform X2 n=1 Tax=Harmonia axyridis TaxID=115357 RepID=UPI001E2767D9|nr:DNA excision repair protein ERCC-5 isoform X2 [Harmonia axyridis]